METIHYVIAAGAVTWLGIGVYLYSIAQKQRALTTRLHQLELLEGTQHDQ